LGVLFGGDGGGGIIWCSTGKFCGDPALWLWHAWVIVIWGWIVSFLHSASTSPVFYPLDIRQGWYFVRLLCVPVVQQWLAKLQPVASLLHPLAAWVHGCCRMQHPGPPLHPFWGSKYGSHLPRVSYTYYNQGSLWHVPPRWETAIMSQACHVVWVSKIYLYFFSQLLPLQECCKGAWVSGPGRFLSST